MSALQPQRRACRWTRSRFRPWTAASSSATRVYEVLRVYRGKPWLEDEHFDRLARSLAAIRIGGVDLDRLRRRMHETIAAGGFREASSTSR